MKQKIVALLLCGILIFTGCSSSDTGTSSENGESTSSTESDAGTSADTGTSSATAAVNLSLTGEYSDKALDWSYDESEATKIVLAQDATTIDGEGATDEGNVITITEPGTYVVSGTLTDGRIEVNLTEDKNVHLVLDGVDITCSDYAAICVQSVKNIYLTLADGSENRVSDGSSYTLSDTEDDTNAAIFSKDDMIINGTGSLVVEANYKDGITSKDDLAITAGTITVEAVDDAIVGKDSVSILDGEITLTAGGDTIKSSNTEDTTKGYVVVDGGSFTMSAGDDAIHAETELVINGGEINVSTCVEGLESLNIVLNDGTVNVTATDDGVNVSGGTDTTSSDVPMRGMGGGMDEAIDGALYINGGNLTIDAQGDGIDSNGSVVMTGGTVMVTGPSNAGNGVLDYSGTFEISGGVLLATGVSGMDQAPSTESEQASVVATAGSMISADEELLVKDAEGNVLYTFSPARDYNYIVVSAPEIEAGQTYTLEADGQTIEAEAGSYTSQGSMTPGNGGGGMGGGRGGAMMDGTAPTDEDSTTRPERPDGTAPTGEDGTTPPEMPDGTAPAAGDGTTLPELPDGAAPTDDAAASDEDTL